MSHQRQSRSFTCNVGQPLRVTMHCYPLKSHILRCCLLRDFWLGTVSLLDVMSSQPRVTNERGLYNIESLGLSTYQEGGRISAKPSTETDYQIWMRNEVKWRRQYIAFVQIWHPHPSSRELPLDISIVLKKQHQIVNIRSAPLRHAKFQLQDNIFRAFHIKTQWIATWSYR